MTVPVQKGSTCGDTARQYRSYKAIEPDIRIIMANLPEAILTSKLLSFSMVNGSNKYYGKDVVSIKITHM